MTSMKSLAGLLTLAALGATAVACSGSSKSAAPGTASGGSGNTGTTTAGDTPNICGIGTGAVLLVDGTETGTNATTAKNGLKWAASVWSDGLPDPTLAWDPIALKLGTDDCGATNTLTWSAADNSVYKASGSGMDLFLDADATDGGVTVARPVDLSKYTGISFALNWAGPDKSGELKVQIGHEINTPPDAPTTSGKCTKTPSDTMCWKYLEAVQDAIVPGWQALSFDFKDTTVFKPADTTAPKTADLTKVLKIGFHIASKADGGPAKDYKLQITKVAFY